MLYQRTVKAKVAGCGVGLHSGESVRFEILPAGVDTGIIFERTDLSPSRDIPARVEHVLDTRLATRLGRDGVTISTVEHLMAALYGLGIDNARVRVDGPEVPILDGSAEPFVQAILEAGGTVAQHRPKRFLVVRRPVTVRDGGRTARLEPASSFELDLTIDFDHPLIRDQRLSIQFSDRTFLREICRARTFGFGRDVDAMRNAGLALGGSLDNAVVIDDFSIRNPEGLRFPDEFVRHKVLDAIGDLALIGAPIIGRFTGDRTGHSMNTRLVAELLAQPRAFELVEFSRRREAQGQGLELPALGLRGFAPA
jgi:UDP-3-O-[3-hydroxymyristoyl] N-acetylglucosamine deacetylase